MFCPLQLVLIPTLLACSLGLNDFSASPAELTVHVGDSALMGCVFWNLEGKHLTKVDWMLSPGKHAEDEYVLYYYGNLSVPVGRFRNRVVLAGDLLQKDGSLLLQDVQEADQGTYTCEIRLESESKVLKSKVVLHVLPEEPKEVTVHVGDSALMRCIFHSTEKKRLTQVDWMFSSGEHTKEIVLHYDLKFQFPERYFPYQGRYQNRVNLVGDISHNDGSILLQRVKESDGGIYNCSIHLGNLLFRKTLVLHVTTEKSQTLIPEIPRPELLGGNQLVIIVGIVCATLLLFPVLILIVKRTHWNKSSLNSTAFVKSLENMEKAYPEKHVYSSITTQEVREEEEPSGKSEATYMTMHPVWPSLRSVPAGGIPKPEHAF
ncbi:junctional adhesion molecule-like [Marmota marmota marmota]|uniref:junctional adhesion molecule-like n=1 Tax=Marmota marmota marmota TaxID=9994 RepID=UPI000762A57D|nr:junctional adhesion molecule-like [Marmota marmota marmota]XP_048651864.1 junctional adhesion molecule-like [Marmota marmota marmota]XP_048651865.1 junctional adhesion molecule-like [Marmota marmota marmota]